MTTSSHDHAYWVRGVNLGGWLLLERFITPYMFAVTDCHLQEPCWYPHQISAPPTDAALCSDTCRPLIKDKEEDPYPMDEHALAVAFGREHRVQAEQWLNAHFEHFITRDDIRAIRQAGLTHVRVPLPHWILYNDDDDDDHEDTVWIAGDRWKYFRRLVQWCREEGLQVWPDIHTASGSQNGFDNSGFSGEVSCRRWSDNATHVQESLQVIRTVSARMVQDGLDDVVTGFGLLNEPFKDCNRAVYEDFIEQGLDIVRSTMSPNTAVYVSDLFLADTFNNGHWWLDSAKHNHTYLDSHYYHVFAEQPRALSPRQHIAYVCENEYVDATSCCFEQPRRPGLAGWLTGRTVNSRPSSGVTRMIGEWSAATDTLPVAKLQQVMQSIAVKGVAAEMNRTISAARADFLLKFCQAQMVAYEAAQVGSAGAWFYWTVKMEGGAFAEWDFLRGVREGWIPRLPTSPTVSSESIYGSCYDIIFETKDDMSIIDEFPDPSTLPNGNWQGVLIDDDVVVSHGDSLVLVDGEYAQRNHHPARLLVSVLALVLGLLGCGDFGGPNGNEKAMLRSPTRTLPPL